jgi:hypothetical protein
MALVAIGETAAGGIAVTIGPAGAIVVMIAAQTAAAGTTVNVQIGAAIAVIGTVQRIERIEIAVIETEIGAAGSAAGTVRAARVTIAATDPQNGGGVSRVVQRPINGRAEGLRAHPQAKRALVVLDGLIAAASREVEQVAKAVRRAAAATAVEAGTGVAAAATAVAEVAAAISDA